MATIHSEQVGSWRYITSHSLGTTGATPNGDMFDFRPFSRGVIYATSTHGTPTLTFWTAGTSTGPFRLLKTSTGGAVALTIVSNAAVSFPAAAANAQWVRFSGTTGAAYQTIPAMLLKKT